MCSTAVALAIRTTFFPSGTDNLLTNITETSSRSQSTILETEEGSSVHPCAARRAHLGRVLREFLFGRESHISFAHGLFVVEAADVLVSFCQLEVGRVDGRRPCGRLAALQRHG